MIFIPSLGCSYCSHFTVTTTERIATKRTKDENQMREPYICPDCDQRSTRWWNLKIHMKRKHDGFLLGKSSDGYMANSPPLYSKSVQLGHPTVADTSFQSGYVLQQAPLGTSQHYTNPIYRRAPSVDDLSGLSQGKILKIDELKRLVNRYSQYCMNPDGILRLAIYNSINGDGTLLDNKLEQLRKIDRRLNGS